MRVAVRRIRALLLILACALLAGCGRDAVVSLPDWTLSTAGGADHAVHLPFHADAWLGTRRERYSLRARATIPPEWRGRPLTLVIPFLEAPTSLMVDDEEATSLDKGALPELTTSSSHAYRIDASRTRSGELSLELVVDHASAHAAWLDTIPRLSATPAGDRAFLATSLLDGPVALASYAVVSMIGFTYFVLYFFDRRRKAHLWFALQASGVAYYTLEVIGVPQAALGLYTFSALATPLSGIAGMCFVHAYFGTPAPRRGLQLLTLACLVLCPFAVGRFAAGGAALELCILIIMFCNVPYILLQLSRAIRAGRDRFSATMLFAGWVLITVSIAPDIAYAAGLGELADGARTSVLGFGLFSVVQAVVLGRDHIRSLNVADARVAELEARARENALLSDELRRQIADRSQRLTDALARIGAIPEKTVTLAPGDEVQGRYRTIRPIGAGGMGAVYEVERLADGRRLALKVLTSARTGMALARLAREARVAALTSHPNLVSIVDVDVSATGSLYIVMELVDGATLHDHLDRYRDVGWARGVLAQIARGLAALHAQGVVHRDLKPGNVLLTPAGVAKIADFGIARVGPDSDEIDPLAHTSAAEGERDAMLTGTGVFMGTPLYMAPEMARGARHAAPPSDVFSFGLIAYELLAGRLPFETPAVLGGAGEAVRLEVAGLSEAVARAVERCLSLVPGARPTASEIAAVLEEPCAK